MYGSEPIYVGSYLVQRLKAFASRAAEQAGVATGEDAGLLFHAAYLWLIAADYASDKGFYLTGDILDIALKADRVAAQGGYDGPPHAPELVTMAAPKPRAPRGPRVAITAFGRITVPDHFDA